MGITNEAKASRNSQIFEKNQQGIGVRRLAKEYGISRERVRQVLDQERQRRGGDGDE